MEHSAPRMARVICTSCKSMAPDNDVVDEVPVFEPWMHPKRLVHVAELEEDICDGKDPIQSTNNCRRPLLFMLPTP